MYQGNGMEASRTRMPAPGGSRIPPGSSCPEAVTSRYSVDPGGYTDPAVAQDRRSKTTGTAYRM